MDATLDDAEEARLLALEALDVLDTPPEDRFDRVTRLCTRLFGVPVAAVALVSRDRWFAKSRQGLGVRAIVLVAPPPPAPGLTTGYVSGRIVHTGA
jgi:hypothetical protein